MQCIRCASVLWPLTYSEPQMACEMKTHIHTPHNRCLLGMRPSLDELMNDARLRMKDPAHPTLQHLEQRYLQFQGALAIARGQAPSFEPPEPPPHTTTSVSVPDRPPGSSQPSGTHSRHAAARQTVSGA